MKPETLIYDQIRKITPEKSSRNIFFAAITQTSYEIFFYSYINGVAVQCYELAEQGLIDENDLDKAFGAIAGIIRDSKVFDTAKINIATITVDKSGINMGMEYVDKNARMYKIKKEWEQNNIELSHWTGRRTTGLA